MFRNSLSCLYSWSANPQRKPLLLRGARQVGKSFLVDQFGFEKFGVNYIKFDFEAKPQLKKIFEDSLEPKDVIPRLELLANKNIVDSQSLIFFDEIQACPSALLALKYFKEQRPDLHLIAAGSLLEFALETVSFPVGAVQTLTLYPMCFYEFLRAIGKDKSAEIINSSPCALSEFEHDALLQDYKNFLFVGGLPEAVKIYSETGSILRATEVQSDLTKMYEADFNKYGRKVNLECLRQVFKASPQRLTKPLKFRHLSDDFSVPTIKGAVNVLCMAQVLHKVSSVNPIGLPLGASASPKLFKLIMLDIGLIHGLSKMLVDFEFDKKDILFSYRGLLAEQAVGQALLAQSADDIFTWYRPVSGSQAEVDFVISKSGNVIPIEVKSGQFGKLKSLHIFLKEYPLARMAYLISTSKYNVNAQARITSIPIYYSGSFLKWI